MRIAPRAIFYPLSSILVGLLLSGCVKETKPVAAVSKAPLIVDEAMQQRQWHRSVVRFQNGESPAGPTEFALAHPDNTPALIPIITDGPMFLINVGISPLDVMINPPWTRVIYPAGVIEPSYTGVPPQPPKK
jgi:hypothetical protein